MGNGNYEETHERILKSGLEAFLREGYEKANLRRICKAAGVTTGAFYKHFKDKEALFSELVEPLASTIRTFYAQGEERGFAEYEDGRPVTQKQVRESLELKARGTLETTVYLYSRRDLYELLVFRSYGTPYEGFLEELVAEEDRTTSRMLKLIHGHIEGGPSHHEPRFLQRPLGNHRPRGKRGGAARHHRGHLDVLQCRMGEVPYALIFFFASKIT